MAQPVSYGRLRAGLARRLEVRRRRALLRLARPAAPFLLVERAGCLFVAPIAEAEALLVHGSRGEFVVLERAVATLASADLLPAARTTIVDVGANIGTTVISALRLHGFTAAVAIEADADNVRLLRANLELNDVADRAAVVAAAASADSQPKLFQRAAARGSGKSGVGRIVPGPSADSETVRAATLDQLVDEGTISVSEVGLVWLDVQGHEGHVLAGARAIVDAGIPLVFALRPKLLRAAGGWDHLERSVGRRYDTLVDLRAPSLKAGWTPRLEPIASLRRYRHDARSTDLLVLT